MRKLIESATVNDGLKGLNHCKIDRLAEVTVLTGPNGGGKSRLLQSIAATIGQYAFITQTRANITAYKNLLKSQRHDAANLQREIDNWETALQQFIELEFADGVFTNELTAIYFAPQISHFVDPGQMNFGQTLQVLQDGGKLNLISSNFQNTLFIIQSLIANYLISRSPDSGFPPRDVENLSRRYDNLERSINQILGMKLSWTAGPTISIGNTPLNQIASNFSQGQKWLLHFIASTFSDMTVEDRILLCIDEPELHLHPAALNQIIDRLRSSLTNGQLIVATHSIPLIAHLGYENVWYVAENRITYAGKKPEQVINGLVGGEDGANKLRQLLNEPNSAAIARFALESLSPPSVSGPRAGDPQANQIVQSVRAKFGEIAKPIRFLDFGAGKGRLLDIASIELGTELVTLIDYYAYDPSEINADSCKLAIARAYPESSERFFEKKSSIPEMISGDLFDVVSMCNVLHEISPTDWLGEFRFIASILEANGELLIVEDLQLPHGEHAHSEGFIIGSREAFRRMFKIEPSESTKLIEVRPLNPKLSHRLLCIRISASVLNRATSETLRDALSYLRASAQQRIKEIRDQKLNSYSAGLEHALHLHQFANSSLALDRFS